MNKQIRQYKVSSLSQVQWLRNLKMRCYSFPPRKLNINLTMAHRKTYLCNGITATKMWAPLSC